MGFPLLTAVHCCEMLRHQAQRLLTFSSHQEIIPRAVQQEQVELLKTTLRDEKFFFVVNLLSFQTEHVSGTEHWLGCKPEALTVEKYFSIIHPAHLAVQMNHCYQLLESLLSGEHPVEFMRPCITGSIALQHASGKYFLFKRIVCPFQHDQDFRLLSYLNEFILVGPFNGETYNARISDCTADTLLWHKEMQRRARAAFNSLAPFSVQELRVLGRYAHDPLATTTQVARIIQVKESTIITYKKRILDKAEKYFHQRFKSARDAAQYLKASGLL